MFCLHFSVCALNWLCAREKRVEPSEPLLLVYMNVYIVKAPRCPEALRGLQDFPVSSFLSAGPDWTTGRARGQGRERSAAEQSRWPTVPPGGENRERNRPHLSCKRACCGLCADGATQWTKGNMNLRGKQKQKKTRTRTAFSVFQQTTCWPWQWVDPAWWELCLTAGPCPQSRGAGEPGTAPPKQTPP